MKIYFNIKKQDSPVKEKTKPLKQKRKTSLLGSCFSIKKIKID